MAAIDGGYRHLIPLVDATRERTQRHEGVAVDMDTGGGDARGAAVAAQRVARQDIMLGKGASIVLVAAAGIDTDGPGIGESGRSGGKQD